MANFKALAWVETFTVGGPTARAVLDKIALKANDKFELYRSAPAIAGLCELSPKPMRRALDSLEAQGVITRIRRIRPNGSEAPPVTVLNHPDAPHLNGRPVVLDFEGEFRYPADPDALRATGIKWVSGGIEGQVHRKHRSTGGGVVSETRGGGPSDQGGVVPPTTHGVVSPPPLKGLPKEHPTNQRARARREAAGAARGGDGSSSPEEKLGDAFSPAVQAIVAEVQEAVPGWNLSDVAAVTIAAAVDAGHESDLILDAILDTQGFKDRAAGVGTNIRNLVGRIAQKVREREAQPQDGASGDQPWPEWCGQCDESTRLAEDAQTLPYRCPNCHPSIPTPA